MTLGAGAQRAAAALAAKLRTHRPIREDNPSRQVLRFKAHKQVKRDIAAWKAEMLRKRKQRKAPPRAVTVEL